MRERWIIRAGEISTVHRAGRFTRIGFEEHAVRAEWFVIKAPNKAKTVVSACIEN